MEIIIPAKKAITSGITITTEIFSKSVGIVVRIMGTPHKIRIKIPTKIRTRAKITRIRIKIIQIRIVVSKTLRHKTRIKITKIAQIITTIIGEMEMEMVIILATTILSDATTIKLMVEIQPRS